MKKNPFLIGYLAVTVVGAAALGFLVYTAFAHYTEVSDTYETQVGKLLSIKNRTPYPSPENNEAFKKLTDEYKVQYEKLVAQASEMQTPVESITPTAFQDKLRKVVSEVREAADANKVALPDGFYLGFNRYEGELPSNEAAGPLARQLASIRLVIDQLIESKVQRITNLRRSTLPEESGGGGAPATSQRGGPGNRGPSQEASSEPLVQRSSFDVEFVADQARVRQSLNSIARADQFLIIRALNITNSQLSGPSREAPPASAEPAATPESETISALVSADATAGDGSSSPSNLRILVGQESLTVAARIEMLNFNLAQSSKE